MQVEDPILALRRRLASLDEETEKEEIKIARALRSGERLGENYWRPAHALRQRRLSAENILAGIFQAVEEEEKLRAADDRAQRKKIQEIQKFDQRSANVVFSPDGDVSRPGY